MRMLCWMCVRLDGIWSEMTTLERVGVAPLLEKMVEARLRWFGHVKRRSIDFVVKSLEAKGDLEKL